MKNITLLLIAIVALIGCGEQGGTDVSTDIVAKANAAKQSVSEEETKNEHAKATGDDVMPEPHPETVELDEEQVERGKVLFNQICVACHQPDGAGRAGLAPRLNSPDFLGLANDTYIKDTILNGRPGTAMIGYKVMPNVADNVDDLVVYIRSWQNDYATFRDYHVDWTATIDGDPKEGQKAFRNFCASCHGINGGGYADGGSGPGIGLPGFLDVASDDYIKKTIQVGRAGTAMKPFGHGRGLANIDETDINNIVAYLRSLQD